MRQQLFFIRHASEIPAEHLIRPQRRLTARPKRYQHTRDNGRIGLQFDAIAVVTEQMPAAKNVLEKAKEYLDGPAILEDQPNNIRVRIEQIGGDPTELAQRAQELLRRERMALSQVG